MVDYHENNLAEAFKVMRKHWIRLNLEKCAFGVTSGKFLEFMVHHRGIEANPEKIKAIAEMLAPRTVKQLQSLNEKIAALNQFVSKSTEKCLPFFKTLRKEGQFDWTNECEEAFAKLKEYLASVPLLAKLNPGDELFIYLSVSDNVVSSALVKEGEGRQAPVYYTRKALTGPEVRYSQMEKLALALIISARKFRLCFQAHRITVLTNHPLR